MNNYIIFKYLLPVNKFVYRIDFSFGPGSLVTEYFKLVSIFETSNGKTRAEALYLKLLLSPSTKPYGNIIDFGSELPTLIFSDVK
ncbi:hypothetical protein DICPUDRAFT_153066 [Dictyostelium purpureum]|uniref:Uncharacterized protein n=1 Tax=Dictyostelium purpureum TaxID=5786 RepID=F0ZMZ1_DICPU|nr:uncharacterized protein DICPUDRAFT_153066 [Dictyostelium purpureum]EGC34694.1 hypothetical protein DICPUDRAFT_153066 [Dictyostelium purpureum]|eukprot:XP_003288779.1 hypothetical protein DICPUDRAFT_153066 [Dictyostelium purpureum]